MNKKLLTAAAVLLLSSCANQAGNGTAVYESSETAFVVVSAAVTTENISDKATVSETETETSETTSVSEIKTESHETTAVPAASVQASESADKTEFSISDDELIALAYADHFSADYVIDYTVLDNMGHTPAEYESCSVTLVPVSESIEEYAADEKNYPEFYEEKTEGDGVIRKIGENDLYSQWINEYTEIRNYYSNDLPVENHIPRAYRRVYLKNLRQEENSKWVYTGEFTADDIKAVFDIFYMNTSMLSRDVYERDGTFVYSFYYTLVCYGDFGLNDEISLCKMEVEIFSDGTVKTGSAITVKRCEIPDSALTIEWRE